MFYRCVNNLFGYCDGKVVFEEKESSVHGKGTKRIIPSCDKSYKNCGHFISASESYKNLTVKSTKRT